MTDFISNVRVTTVADVAVSVRTAVRWNRRITGKPTVPNNGHVINARAMCVHRTAVV